MTTPNRNHQPGRSHLHQQTKAPPRSRIAYRDTPLTHAITTAVSGTILLLGPHVAAIVLVIRLIGTAC